MTVLSNGVNVARRPKIVKAERLVAQGRVSEVSGYRVRAWSIKGETGDYIVTTLQSPSGDPRGWFCNCRVAAGESCSHMLAVHSLIELELDPFRGLPTEGGAR